MVGQIARDLVLRVADAPGAGESARVHSREEILGGKGANQAVGVAQLGIPVALLSVAGDDRAGHDLLAHAAADGIDVSHSVIRAGTRSALIVDIVDDHGQWRYLEDIPDTVLVTESDVLAATGLLRAASSVILQLQQPARTTMAAARIAREGGARIVLDGVRSRAGYAGDALIATLTCAFSRGQDLRTAAAAAVAAASGTTGHAGGRPRLNPGILESRKQP